MAEVAQLVEHLVVAQVAVGSSPIFRPRKFFFPFRNRPQCPVQRGRLLLRGLPTSARIHQLWLAHPFFVARYAPFFAVDPGSPFFPQRCAPSWCRPGLCHNAVRYYTCGRGFDYFACVR